MNFHSKKHSGPPPQLIGLYLEGSLAGQTLHILL
jgi:hypothetical protein